MATSLALPERERGWRSARGNFPASGRPVPGAHCLLTRGSTSVTGDIGWKSVTVLDGRGLLEREVPGMRLGCGCVCLQRWMRGCKVVIMLMKVRNCL